MVAATSEHEPWVLVPELTPAWHLVQTGQTRSALGMLNQIKSNRRPVRGADYLRAICFVQEHREPEALEALKEELRLFPDNTEATWLLRKLDRKQGEVALPPDAEFRELFEVVRPYTMLSVERLFSLCKLAREICRQDLPGNFVECGVAGGGSAALLAAVIARHSQRPRRMFAFDTFCGMPNPSERDMHAAQSADTTDWGAGTCAAPVESLLEICGKLGVQDQVEPIRGLFAETLPAARQRIGPISLLHADGDWYESTRDVLENLYERVIPRGRIQIDDYGHWDGCRQAVDEFQERHGLKFELQPIDSTGVWMEKSDTKTPSANAAVRGKSEAGSLEQPARRLLNLGCGARFHPAWVNVDGAPVVPEVRQHDLLNGLPFESGQFEGVYHSHLLEHLPHAEALPFLKECYRVLAPGGIMRVAVPDLETIARLYLTTLDGAVAGNQDAESRYDWMVLELLDQMVREQSGGEMLAYWRRDPMPAEEFVLERAGDEVRQVLKVLRATAPGQSADGAAPEKWPQPTTAEASRFRAGGEVHKWMYDRFSLGRLLQQAGFCEIRRCAADESAIPDYNSYRLDVNEDGAIRKPDSLFLEGRKKSP